MSSRAGEPPELPADLIETLSSSDDERAIASALIDHLADRLRLAGAAVYELSDGHVSQVARHGTPRSDAAAIEAGSNGGFAAVPGGFGYVIPGVAPWLVVLDGDAKPASDADQRTLRIAADAAGIAVAHVRREHRRRTEARTGRALAELAQTLSLEHGRSRVLHLLVLAVARLLPQEGVAAWRIDGDGFELVAAAAYPPRSAPRPGDRVPAAGLLDLTRSRQVHPLTATASGGLARAELAAAVPIGERDANHALLVVERAVQPGSAEERLLLGVADQALLTLENERLLAAERQALDAVVASLGRALSVRHERTGEHSDRLTGDCVAVARRLGIGGERLRDVSFAAALHDLGKIGIPERVLDSRDALGEDDWRLIQTHPELGARIVDPVPALAGAAALIRACHEHWDGSGYPLGLRGVQIPLGARVVFTCDAYHAMRESRPYQRSLSDREARDRLRDLSGTHFDPAVVTALLEHLEGEAG